MLKRLCLSLLVACASLAGAMSALAYSNQVQCGTWTVGGIALGCAGPTSTAGSFNDSGYWPGWAVLSLTAGATVVFDGKITGVGGTASATSGNVGIWGATNFDVKGDARVSGNAYITSGATGFPDGEMDSATLSRIQGANGYVANFTSDVLLWQAQQKALMAAQQAFGLTPNTTFAGNTTLTQNITITATAANSNCNVANPAADCRVVLNYDGDLNLGNFTLTLDRGIFTNVDFILNIGTSCPVNNMNCGDLTGNGTSGITLAGAGVTWMNAWADVLINVRDDVNITSNTTGSNRYSGILVAGGPASNTSGDIGLDGTQWTGEVIGFGGLNFDNGARVTNPGGLITMVQFIPVPGTLLLLLLAGALVAVLRAFSSSGARGALLPA